MSDTIQTPDALIAPQNAPDLDHPDHRPEDSVAPSGDVVLLQRRPGGVKGNQHAYKHGLRRRSNDPPTLGVPPKGLARQVGGARVEYKGLLYLIAQKYGDPPPAEMQMMAREYAELEVSRRALWTLWRKRTDATISDIRGLRQDIVKCAREQREIVEGLKLDPKYNASIVCKSFFKAQHFRNQLTEEQEAALEVLEAIDFDKLDVWHSANEILKGRCDDDDDD